MKFFNFVKIFCLFIIIVSCSNQEAKIKKELIAKDNLMALKEKIKSSNELSPLELEYFNNAMLRFGTADSLVGKTVKDIIDGQIQFLKNNQYKSIDINLTTLHMNEQVKVTFLQKVKAPIH